MKSCPKFGQGPPPPHLDHIQKNSSFFWEPFLYPDVSDKASSDKNIRTWLSELSPGVTENSRLIFTPFENLFLACNFWNQFVVLSSTEKTRLFDDCLGHGCPHSRLGAVLLLWWLSWNLSNGILLFLVEAGKKENLVRLWCLMTTKSLPGLLECFSSILLLLRTSSSCNFCQGPGLGALMLSASRYEHRRRHKAI